MTRKIKRIKKIKYLIPSFSEYPPCSARFNAAYINIMDLYLIKFQLARDIHFVVMSEWKEIPILGVTSQLPTDSGNISESQGLYKYY